MKEMLTPGILVDVAIDKPAAGGRMIARHEGQVILVSGAIPGERVRARIERIGRGVVYGATFEVLEPSPDRRAGLADWACGGNVYAHIAYPRQSALKAEVLADALARIGRLALDAPVHVAASPEQGYRMRARLHVREGGVGFFREGTHELCDPAGTGQLLEETCHVLARLGLALRARQLDGIEAVELAENIPGTERVIHLEVDRDVDPNRLSSLFKIGSVTGLTCAETSTAGVSRATVLHGLPFVTDALEIGAPGAARGRVVFRRHAQSFFQANRYLVQHLVSRVTTLVPEGRIVDLYAGVGLFALSLAAAGRDPVVAVEGDRVSAEDLRANARPYGQSVRTLRMPVEEYLQGARVEPGTTLIVDPPRTGMSREAVNGLLARRADRILYVSCDVATLARDLGRLVASGYRLEHIEAFDLFPNTAHVEALAVLTRS
jgi:tRNA/tmRNA/rRNA uracil-C5-methylase (TrmA/RlmC/RlmD family)